MRFHRRNLNPLFGRGFAVAGLAAIAAFTVAGSWESNPQNWLILGLVWASGIGALVHFLRTPVVTTSVEHDGTLVLTLQSGFGSRRLRCAPGSVAPPVLRTFQNSGKGNYIQCLVSVGSEEITVLGTYDLDLAEQVRDELAVALGHGAVAAPRA